MGTGGGRINPTNGRADKSDERAADKSDNGRADKSGPYYQISSQ